MRSRGSPRNPSHFGSYCHSSPVGSSRTSSASIGGNGIESSRLAGRSTGSLLLRGRGTPQPYSASCSPLLATRASRILPEGIG